MGINYPNTLNLNISQAIKLLDYKAINSYKVLYKESKKEVGRVIDQRVLSDGTLTLTVGSSSLIKSLPSNYQNSDSLKDYLMIFQHFNNEFNRELDNIHNIFNPMETRREFLLWLSSWFSLEIGAQLPEVRYRRLIREIVPLYRWRGTKVGLSRILEIISGYKPEIIEGYYDEKDIQSESISFTFSEVGSSENLIVIKFPISQKELGGRTVKTLFNIVDKEKPAHISCRLIFIPDHQDKKDDYFTIGEVAVVTDSRL